MKEYIDTFGLQPGDDILVKIRGYNDNGPGDWSEAPWGTFVQSTSGRRLQAETALMGSDFDKKAFQIQNLLRTNPK